MSVYEGSVYLVPGARTEARKRHYAAAATKVAKQARLEKPKRKIGKIQK